MLLTNKLHSEQVVLRKNDVTETKPPDLHKWSGMDAADSSETHS